MDTSLFSEKLVQNVCPDPPLPPDFDCGEVSALDHFTYLLAAGFEKRGDLLNGENRGHAQGSSSLELYSALSEASSRCSL